ncbi:uncharacterized protein METZ01_LOCUS457802, partial [marine metagenome]
MNDRHLAQGFLSQVRHTTKHTKNAKPTTTPFNGKRTGARLNSPTNATAIKISCRIGSCFHCSGNNGTPDGRTLSEVVHTSAERSVYSSATFCELRVSCLALSSKRNQTIAALVFSASTLTLAQGTVSAQAPVAGESVAVVVFTNITGESVDDWIGRGIAETLSTELERVG